MPAAKKRRPLTLAPGKSCGLRMQQASRVQAAAEVAALLASPPAWLDLDGPHDTELAPLDLHNQRGRGPPATKLAWRWSCAVLS